jgi:hypothetical protein
MRAGLLRSTMWLAAVFATAAVFGCAEIQTEWDRFHRGTPVRKTGYFGQKDEILFSPPVIQPGAVARGETLSYRMSYTLHSPDESKEFLVVEVITLSSPSLHLELSRKTMKKRKGNYVMKIEFAVPPDLPPGPHEIVSTVRAGGLEKQQSGSFSLTRR